MKKVLSLLAVGAIAISASADLTEFGWASPGDVVGGTGSEYVLSMLDADGVLDAVWADAISSQEINIADLQAVAEIGSSLITINAKTGTWYSDYVTGTGARAGQYAFAVITTADSIASIVQGDYIGISAINPTAIAELDADGVGGDPRLAAQEFAGGGAVNINVEVIPEPATLGLMGLAGLGMFLARRKARC